MIVSDGVIVSDGSLRDGCHCQRRRHVSDGCHRQYGIPWLGLSLCQHGRHSSDGVIVSDGYVLADGVIVSDGVIVMTASL